MSDKAYEVSYSYNVTGAVQTESFTLQAESSEEAKRVAIDCFHYFHAPSRYDLFDFAVRSAPVDSGALRSQWEMIYNDC